MKIRELAKLIEGQVEGSDDIDINGLSGIEKAKSGDLTFAIDEAKLDIAEKSKASCILTNKTIRKSSKALIRVTNPKLSFLIIYNALMHLRTGSLLYTPWLRYQARLPWERMYG